MFSEPSNKANSSSSSAFITQSPHAIQSLENLQKELKSWRANLPPELKLQNLNPKAYGFRSVVHLHQNYHHAWIMMCRIPLLMLVRERLKSSFTPSTPTTASTIPSDLDKSPISQMAISCSKAARKMIRLFEILRDNDYLARFSFTDFHGCSIATIIILLHGILERDVAYNATLAFAVESLRWMASESETARLGARFVEGFKQLADEAVSRMEVRKEKDVGKERGDEGYERWLRWVGESERKISQHAELYQQHLPTTEDPDFSHQPVPQAPSSYPTQSPFSPAPASIPLTGGTAAYQDTHHQPPPSAPSIPSQIPSFDTDLSSSQHPQQQQQDFQTFDPFSADLDQPLYGFSDDSFILGFTGLDVLNYRDF